MSPTPGTRLGPYEIDFTSELEPNGELEIGRPQKLFTLPVEWSGFAPAPKGDRFLLLEPVGSRSQR